MLNPIRKPARPTRGAGLIRNSTAAQVDNAHSALQEAEVIRLLAEAGLASDQMDIFWEQGTSGSDLRKRPVAREVIEGLEAGRWRCFAVIEVSRASRDPDGVDQRIFKRACRTGHALLLTPSKAYDFRNDADDLQYEVESLFAAREWRIIRKRTWNGLVERAKIGPVFQGKVPIGYRATKSTITIGSTPRLARTLEKDPDQKPLMDALVEALNAEPTAEAVARRMNSLRLFPPMNHARTPDRTIRNEGKGNRIPEWNGQRISDMLRKSLYAGRWVFGNRRKSEMWESLETDIVHLVPELAYWTEVEARVWLRRFALSQKKTPQRRRRWDHPLLGILICRHCKRSLTGQGQSKDTGVSRYGCGWYHTGRCPGQSLNQEIAFAAIREKLPEIQADIVGVMGEVRRILSEQAMTDARETAAEIALLDRKIAGWTDEIDACINSGIAVTQDMREKMKGYQQEREQLMTQQASRPFTSDELEAILAETERFEQPLEEWYDTFTPEVKAMFLHNVIDKVEIETTGRGNWAKARVISWEVIATKVVSDGSSQSAGLNHSDSAKAVSDGSCASGRLNHSDSAKVDSWFRFLSRSESKVVA